MAFVFTKIRKYIMKKCMYIDFVIKARDIWLSVRVEMKAY